MTSEALQPEPGTAETKRRASVDRLRENLHRPMLAHAQSFVRDWKQADALTKSAFAQLSAALASGEAISDADAWLRKKIQEAAREAAREIRPVRSAETSLQNAKVLPPQTEPASPDARIPKLERELVLSAKRVGATNDFNRLFSEYAGLRQRTLEAIARRITQSAHAAEDVVQESFVALHRQLLDKWTGGEIGPWLTRVVINRAINHAHKQRTRKAAPLDSHHVISGQSSPEEACILAERTAVMWECVAGLPEVQRRIVELRTTNGMDYAGIGALLSIPPDKVRRYYYRAVERLRENMVSQA